MQNKFVIKAAHILAMLQLQDRLNSKVNPNWATAGNKWMRAIWVKCAELMDHIGWKWWKKQEPNVEQIKLELVDIWHFVMSQFIEDAYEDKRTLESLANRLVVAIDDCRYNEALDTSEVFDSVEAFTEGALNERLLCNDFFQLCVHYGLSGEELYKLYVAKNVLNIFRQDNGYKEGTYNKYWYDGREDNEHLNDIFAAYPDILPDDLLEKLEQRYTHA